MLLLHACAISHIRPFFSSKTTKVVLITLFMFVTGSLSAQSDISALRAERSVRISESSSTKDIDLRLYELGERPAAVIRYSTLENGTIRLEFPIYLPVNAERAERVVQRLTATYPFLTSMQLNPAEDQAICILQAGTSEEQMEEITTHFGYSGHETVH